MKRILILILAITYSWQSNAGCPLINVPLKDRINENEIVVEATVISKFSYKNKADNFIYTAHTLQVHKYFKGNLSKEFITFLTEGGVVGNEALGVSPNLETQIGQSGIFFLTKNISWDNPSGETQTFYSKTGPLGFIYYDYFKKEAFDNLNQWGEVQNNLIPQIKSLTNQEIVVSQLNEPKVGGRRATPTITSFSPTSMVSGTQQILTITGTGFGATRGNGFVQFPDANSGGSGYIIPNKGDYVSWTDTEIKLKVLTRAGTGKFKVFNNAGDNVTSSSNLTINWAHLNVNYFGPPNVPDTTAFETQHIGENGNGGITWIWDSQFITNTPAVGSFIRALESWRCNTLINWDTAGIESNDTMLKDSKNMVFFDKGWMGSSVLGTCYSYYMGCYTPGGMNWYVIGLDIVFKKTYNWEFGPTTASGGKTDFESVALHELGHGHQLGHVINSNNVMHYSIGANQNKRTLQTNDTACGNYVMRKSITSVCGNPAMVLINPGACQFVPLVADFSVDKSNVCAKDTVIFSDLSQGNISTWSWDFGLGASPATATGQGPHKVIYNIGGNKTVKLDITSGAASDSKQYTAMVSVKSTSQPVADFNSTFVKGCEISFSVIDPIPTTTYSWDFDGQGTATGNNSSFIFSSGGTVNVKLTATNSCNSIDESKAISFICTDFSTDVQEACIEDTVTFTNLSGPANTTTWNFGIGANPPTATGVGPHKVVYSSGGSKSITISTSDANSSQSVTNNILIKNANHPIAGFSYDYKGNFEFGFTNTSNGINNTYNWDFGDGNTSTDKDPLYKYSNNPNGFVVVLTAENACDTSSFSMTLPNHLSVQSLNNSRLWSIYPNPTKSLLNIRSEDNTHIQKIIITDILGKSVLIKTFDAQISEYSFSVQSLSNGVYTISIYSENGMFKQLFNKE
ncbi:MAG: T9SS type A sorting domain-containing protein [Bacteroidetes bacterium]|nr:T9SS type A sorting domain-containing protein [Bacteroidota bacterium]